MNERRPGQFLPTGFAFQVLVQRVAAIHARSKASLEEELTVDTARQTLQDIVDMCAGALQLNARLGSLSNGYVAPTSGPFLMLPQPAPTIISQKPLSGEMVCVPLNEIRIDNGLSAEPLEVVPPVQNIRCEQSLSTVFWPSGGKLTFSWICDVLLGFDWSSRNLPPSDFSSVLPFNVLDELVLSASKILKKEPNCVRIDSDKAKVVVVGDLHGQLHDLLFLMQDAGFPNGDQFYVFNGNYVDNGAWGLETFLLVLSWKVFLPDRVFLLRGGHESESCTSLYGFKYEVLTKYGDKGAVVYKNLIIRGKEAPHERAKRDGLAPMNEGYANDHEGLITLFSAPDHPQFQITSPLDFSEPMEVEEKDDVDSKCSESKTDEVTAFATLSSSDKDMFDSSEKSENGSSKAYHLETA